MMLQTTRYCAYCGRHTLHAKQAIPDWAGCGLTCLTGGLFLPIWLLFVVASAFASWTCQVCGGRQLLPQRPPRPSPSRALPAQPTPGAPPDAAADAAVEQWSAMVREAQSQRRAEQWQRVAQALAGLWGRMRAAPGELWARLGPIGQPIFVGLAIAMPIIVGMVVLRAILGAGDPGAGDAILVPVEQARPAE